MMRASSYFRLTRHHLATAWLFAGLLTLGPGCALLRLPKTVRTETSETRPLLSGDLLKATGPVAQRLAAEVDPLADTAVQVSVDPPPVARTSAGELNASLRRHPRIPPPITPLNVRSTGPLRINSGPVAASAVQVDHRTIDPASVPRLPPRSAIRQTAHQPASTPLLEADEPPPSPGIPPVGEQYRIPLAGTLPEEDVQLSMNQDRVTLVARNASVQSILNLLAQQQGLNLIAGDDLSAVISVTLNDVPFNDALNSIVSIAGYTWFQQNNIILVTKITNDAPVPPDVQGKVVQVFPLNFVAAADIDLTVKGLLSPTGQSFISQASPTDQRRTQELIVVEDIPASVNRIAQYICQIDQAPRQVMIEAHVLQVDLTDNTRHGVNWKYLTSLAGSDIALSTVGFANPAASPASFLTVNGDRLDVLVEALKSTVDTKTLASPKVAVANGQEARIQIGEKLGYFVTTTTQTSTLQNVNFLNTGVLLRVTPQISVDNRILMNVRPEVSTGRITAQGLPESNTTEAQTTVMLPDGGGMIIGGLIKESDADTQDKVPILGDIWLVGRAFQRRQIARKRSEIIIVLIPRIVHEGELPPPGDVIDIQRATTPIFMNGLQQAPRPLDPRLPDAINNPRRFLPARMKALFEPPKKTNPKPLRFYFPTEDEVFNDPDRPPPPFPEFPSEAGMPALLEPPAATELMPPPAPLPQLTNPPAPPPAPPAADVEATLFDLTNRV